jgi:hypothetical protein
VKWGVLLIIFLIDYYRWAGHHAYMDTGSFFVLSEQAQEGIADTDILPLYG